MSRLVRVKKWGDVLYQIPSILSRSFHPTVRLRRCSREDHFPVYRVCEIGRLDAHGVRQLFLLDVEAVEEEVHQQATWSSPYDSGSVVEAMGL